MPKPGDFFLLQGKDPIGFLTDLGEELNGDGFSIYTHAGMLMDDTGNVLEAEPGGARVAPITEYIDPVVWSSWDLSPDTRRLLTGFGSKMVGRPYSWVDYFALAAHRFHLPLPGLRDYVAASGHMICSQLVDYIYMRCGLNMFSDGRWPGYVTPQDLSHVLKGPQ